MQWQRANLFLAIQRIFIRIIAYLSIPCSTILLLDLNDWARNYSSGFLELWNSKPRTKKGMQYSRVLCWIHEQKRTGVLIRIAWRYLWSWQVFPSSKVQISAPNFWLGHQQRSWVCGAKEKAEQAKLLQHVLVHETTKIIPLQPVRSVHWGAWSSLPMGWYLHWL